MRFHSHKPSQFKNNIVTNTAFNSSLRRDHPNDRGDPVAVLQGQGYGPSPFSAAVGPSGNWTFVEELSDDGVSILTLKFKDVKVHSFAAQ
jgi:hypothetical protein